MFSIVLDETQQQQVNLFLHTNEEKDPQHLSLRYVCDASNSNTLTELELQTRMELQNPWIRSFAQNPLKSARFAELCQDTRESDIIRLNIFFDREQPTPLGRYFRTIHSHIGFPSGVSELWIADASGHCCVSSMGKYHQGHMRDYCIIPEHLQRPISDDEFCWIEHHNFPSFRWIDYPVRPITAVTTIAPILHALDSSQIQASNLYDRNVYRHIIQFALPPPLQLLLSTQFSTRTNFSKGDLPFLWSDGSLMTVDSFRQQKTGNVEIPRDSFPIIVGDSLFFSHQSELHMLNRHGSFVSTPVLSRVCRVAANDNIVAVILSGGLLSPL